MAPLSVPPSHIWVGILRGRPGIRGGVKLCAVALGPPHGIRRRNRVHSTPCISPSSLRTRSRHPRCRSPGRRAGHSPRTRRTHSSSSRGRSPQSCRSHRWRSPGGCYRASGTHRIDRTVCSGRSNLPVPGEGPVRLTGRCLCFSFQPGCPEMDASATSGGPWTRPEHRSPHALHCPVLRGGRGWSHLAVVGCSLGGSLEAGTSQLLWGHRGQCCSEPAEPRDHCHGAWRVLPPPGSPLQKMPLQGEWILLPPAQGGGTWSGLGPGQRWGLHEARRSEKGTDRSPGTSAWDSSCRSSGRRRGRDPRGPHGARSSLTALGHVPGIGRGGCAGGKVGREGVPPWTSRCSLRETWRPRASEVRLLSGGVAEFGSTPPSW